MAQGETQRQTGRSTISAPKEPRKHKVFILNDDFTTFEFVVEIVTIIFMKSQQEAWEIAETTHNNGKALVGVYSLDIARSKVAKATAAARAEGFPLKFEIQPE